MRRNTVFIILISLLVIGVFFSFISSSNAHLFGENPPIAISDSILFNSAPVLSPEQALQTFRLEEGFSIELVASEPLIEDPVAMDFDERGRMWVVEMPSYMPDIQGTGEDQQTGQIVILEDADQDGKMDRSKVFLKDLILPRAVAVVQGGVLVAEPPRLWFVERNGDKAGKKVLVDTAYAVGGNVEHQPNGLMKGMDNWIYNAKSGARYKNQKGQWIKEVTEFRGQWGITQDDFGRLYYNTNSNQLRGDLVPPNSMLRNPNLSPKESVNREIAANQRVFPIRPTPGVNRGYKEETLDAEKKLTSFTAACGPVIYRGNQYPESYYENAFVCEPSANLVKRNILIETGAYVRADQAYANQEFLASTDERFRPVNLYNAPDGNLYLIDMYRGIIQHETYLTNYLKDQIKDRALEKPLGLGRIYRIVYEGNWFDQLMNKFSENQQPQLDVASNEELLSLLSHPNGWWRDMAQHLLVERNNREVVPALNEILEGDHDLAKIHALWVLDGIGATNTESKKTALQSGNTDARAMAIQVAGRLAGTTDAAAMLNVLEEMRHSTDSPEQLQLAISLGEFVKTDSAKVSKMLQNLAASSGNDPLMNEAIASSLHGWEGKFLAAIANQSDVDPSLITLLNEVIRNGHLKTQLKGKDFNKEEKARFILGKSIYEKTCAGCHQENGEGLIPIAPPLAGSNWVLGPEERLIRIVLHGLKGPVTVAGKVYKEPEVQPVMPGLKDNPMFDNEKLAAVLTYIRNTWVNDADVVDSNQVKEIRESEMGRNEPYTEQELLMK